MYLVNNEYIITTNFSMYCEIVKAADECNDNKLEFFEKITRVIINYEQAKKEHIDEFYIRVSDLQKLQYVKTQEIPIARQTILNAILFAAYNNDIEILKQLTQIPINKYELSQDELGENLDYILNHSMDINEYISGEEERFVYNINEHRIEKVYIFNCHENKSYQRLKIK